MTGRGNLCNVGGERDEGSSCIDCCAGVFKLEGFVAEGETIKADFPVPATTNREPRNFPCIVVGIISAKNSLSTVLGILVGVAKVKRKYFIIDQLQ